MQRCLDRSIASRLILAAAFASALLLLPSAATAQSNNPLYWDITGTGSWSTPGNWNSDQNDVLGTSSVPGATNDAVFSNTGFYGATTAQLSAPQAAMGLYFNNTGTTLLESNSSTSETLSIGSDGITINSGAGAVTLGDPTNLMPLDIVGSQAWTNNSSNGLTVLNGVSLDSSITTASTLTLTSTSTATNVISGQISNGGGGGASLALNITQGTWTLSGSNSFSGGTTVGTGSTSGTLRLSGASGSTVTTLGALTNNTTIMSGSTLDLNGSSIAAYTGTINIAGTGVGGIGAITNSSATSLTVPQGLSNITLTANASIGGSAGRIDINGLVTGGGFTLTKTGTNYMAMKGTSTGLAGFIINGGTWEVSTLSGIGSGTVAVNPTGNISFYNPPVAAYTNGFTLSGGEAGVAFGGPATLSGNFTLTPSTTSYLGGTTNGVGNNLSMIISGPIGGSGNLQAGVGGTGGSITLSGANNYTGTTVVSVGTLEFANEGSLYADGTAGSGWSAANITVNSGATLTLAVGTSPQFTASDVSTILTNLSSSSGGFLNNAILGLDTTNAGGSFIYPTAITDNNGGANVLNVTKIGTGALILTGTNTYSGITTINSGGTLQIGNAGAAGSLPASITTVIDNGTLAYNLNVPTTVPNLIGGTGGFSQIGSAAVTLTNLNTYSGPTIVATNSLILGPGTAPTAGLQAHYAFEGNANDSTANANNGTLANGPTYVTGITGQAINFNGSNQYVSIPNSSSLDISGQYTISFWENLNSNYAAQSALGHTNPTFISTRNGTGNTAFDLQLSAGGLHADIGNNTGGWLTTGADATVALPVGTWEMVTYSVTSSGYNIYVDGVNIGSGGYGGSPVLMAASNASQIISVGSQAGGGGLPNSGNALNGAIDELSIYNTALNASQIGSLYTSTSASYILPAASTLTVASGASVNFSGNQTVAGLADYLTAGNGGSIVNTGSSPVTLTVQPASGSTTFSGAIGDAGLSNAITLVKAGAGTQILAGPNTYSGPTDIQNGTLVLGTSTGSNVGSIPATSSVVLGSPTTFGIFQLGDASNPVNQTVASLTTAAGSPTSSAVVGGNASVSTLTINVSSTDTYNGLFGGGGTNQNNLSINKTGSGTLVFNGGAVNSGPTIVSNGILQVTAAGSLPVIQNASFESPALGGNSFSYYTSLTAAQKTALVWVGAGNAAGAGIGPALVNNSTAWGYTTPYPSGNQALTMQSTSTITQMLTFATAGTYTLTWDAEERGGQTNPGAVFFNNVSVDTFTAPNSTTWTPFSTTITVPSAGSYPLEFAGTTAGDQSYGLDNISLYGGLSPNSQMQIASGASLDLYGTSQTVLSLANSSGAGGTVTTSIPGSSTLTLAPAASTSATFGGVIQDGSGMLSLTVNGPGTQVLTGTNNYSGTTRIQNGTLALGTSSGSNVGSIPATSSVVLGNGSTGGIFQLGDANNAVNQTLVSLTTSGTALTNSVVGGNASNSILTINNGSLLTYNGNFGGTGTNQNNLGVTKIGSGTLVFGGVATNSGPTLISNGILRTTSSAAPTVQNPSFESPNIGNNNYIYYASLSAAQQMALLPWVATGTTGTGAVIVNNSGAWGYTIPYPNGNQAINLQNQGTVAQTLSFAAPGTYTLTWEAEGRPGYGSTPVNLILDPAGADTIVTNFTPPTTAWTPYSATITIATAGSHTIEFAGTATSGVSTAIDTVSFGAGGLSATSPLQIASGATLDIDGTLQTILSLANSGGTGGTVTNSSSSPGVLEVFPAISTTTTFGGVIQDGTGGGGVGVTVNGAGTEVLSNVNTYSGPTNLLAGTLRVTGSIANSSMTISGGTLSGTGTTGPVTISSGAIAPGNSGAIGTLTTGNLTVLAGASLNYTLGGSGVGSLISAGALTLPTTTAAVTINVTDNANANGQGSVGNGSYQLIDYTSLSGGNATNFASTFTGVPPVSLTGRSFNVFNTGSGAGAVVLTITQTNPVLYQDTFNRTGSLNGSSPTIENGSTATWTAGAGWTTVATSGGQAAQNADSTSALLPFTPAVNSVYTLSTNVTVTSGGANWLAMGFAASGGTGNINTATTRAWILDRNSSADPQFFYNGGTAAGGNIGGPYASSFGSATLSMVLVTGSTLSNSTVYWLVNGTQAETVAGFNATGINQIILGDGGAAGTAQNLTLASGSYWLATGAATGTTASWNNNTTANDTSGTFSPSQLSGWSGGVIPNSAGAIATFGASIGTTDSMITLDGNQTVGELTFSNSAFSSTGSYTIAAGTSMPTSTLTLDNAGNGAAVTNNYGNNIISAPVILNDSVQLLVGNGSSLTLSGGLTDTGTHRIDIDSTGTTGSVILGGANNTPGAITMYGGTLTYPTGSSNTGGGAYSLLGNSATLTINTANTVAASTLALGAGTSVNLNAGTLALTGNVTAIGTPIGINFNGGTLRNGNTGSTAISIGAAVPININSATAVIDTTGGNINSSAIIAGTGGSLTVQGANTLSLSGPSTFVGATAINAGTLAIGVSNSGSTGAVGPSTNAVTLGAAGSTPASLVTAAAVTFSNPITVAAGNSSSLTLGGSSANASAFSGSSITLDNSLNVSQVIGGSLSIGDSISSGAGGTQTLTFNGAGAVNVGGAIGTGTGTIAVAQSGSGTTTLSGNNTFTSGVNLSGGTLRIGSLGALNSSSPNAVAFSAPSGTATLDLNGYNTTISGLSIASGPAASQIITNSNTSGNSPTATLTYAGGSPPNSFAGTLQDGSPTNLLALNVASGTLVLSGNSTYSGGTAVNGTMLRVANGSGTSATGLGTVSVNNTATLAGSGGSSTPGFIAGAVTVGSNATISPSLAGTSSAESIGTLTVGGLTLNSGSQVNYQVSSSSSLDSIAVTSTSAPTGLGTLTLPSSGSALLNFYVPGTGSTPYTFGVGTYPLMTYGTLVSSQSLNGALSINTGSVPSGDIVTFSTTTVDMVNTLDLVITSNSGSAYWSNPGSSNYGNTANWTQLSGPNAVFPNGVEQTALFGTGTADSITASTVGAPFIVVTNDVNPTLGVLTFDNPTVSYTLSGGTITLNNNNSGGLGAFVNVNSNSHTIESTLLLADPGKLTTFDIASGAALEVTQPINDSAPAGQQIVLSGGGTLTLDAANGYTGGTTVSNGTLTLNSNGTLGSGAVTFNPSSGNTATINVNHGVTLNNLSESPSSGGTAQLNVASSTTLTLNQTASASFGGTVSLASSGALVVQQSSSNDTLTLTAAPKLNSSSTVTVSSGTLAFNVNSGTPTIGSTNVNVTVAAGATLQLAGSVSALSNNSTPTQAANVTMVGTGGSGDGALSVVGTTNQTLNIVSSTAMSSSGAATYAGNTTVGDGTNVANLTVSQILQNTVTIQAGSTLTIAPSGSPVTIVNVAAAPSDAALAATSDSSDSANDPFTAIQAAMASGSISSATGQRLENRLAAIEQLAATDPGLDVSLLESRVLAVLPSSSLWSSGGSTPLADSGTSLLAIGGSTSGSALGSVSTAFDPAAGLGGGPAAVPEPSTLLLAALAGIGMLIAIRRQIICGTHSAG